jgi:hypothetical protein
MARFDGMHRSALSSKQQNLACVALAALLFGCSLSLPAAGL